MKKKELKKSIELMLKIEREYESHYVRQNHNTKKWYIMRREYATFTPPDWFDVAQLTEEQVEYIRKKDLLPFWG